MIIRGSRLRLKTLGGERGIRTPGGVTLNGFQDRRNRPLCHLSLLLTVCAICECKGMNIFWFGKIIGMFFIVPLDFV